MDEKQKVFTDQKIIKGHANSNRNLSAIVFHALINVIALKKVELSFLLL